MSQEHFAHRCGLSLSLLSHFERAYSNQGRSWIPQPDAVLNLIAGLSGNISLAEAKMLADLAGVQIGMQTLADLAWPEDDTVLRGVMSRDPVQTNYRRLRLPGTPTLFGVAEIHQTLCKRLLAYGDEGSYLIALDGIGGIGKTSLANAIAQEMMRNDHFYDLVWIEARRLYVLEASGSKEAVLTPDQLLEALLSRLGNRVLSQFSVERRYEVLRDLLQDRPYLIVLDNLETLVDYETLLPILRELSNPSRFLLTIRHNLRGRSDVFSITVPPLNRENVFALLRNDAKERGIAILAEAPEADLEQIYQVVGGNPLALKLVVGQVSALSLEQVLQNLKRAQGKKVAALYTHIYWQAWQALDDPAVKLLLSMPLVTGGGLDQMASVSTLPPGELADAIETLTELSLIQAEGDLHHRYYTIHRLTETFLLNDVLDWSSKIVKLGPGSA